MCFSATASFTASIVLGIMGLAAISSIPHKKVLPFASIPMLAAFQQMMEGFIWKTQGLVEWAHISYICSFAFLFVALLIWPIWVPWSVYLLEKKPGRKKMILAAGGMGCVSMIMSIYSISLSGGASFITNHHISYQVFSDYLTYFSGPVWSFATFFFYLVPVVGSLFISSVRFMWLLGLASSLGFIIAAIFYVYAFGSVWCFVGAATTVLIYFIIRKVLR